MPLLETKGLVKRSLIWLSVCFLSLLFCASPLSAREVEGSGFGEGSGAYAREEALRGALRNAIQNALGVYLSSETLVSNFQLVKDTIFSRVNGYVQDYEIIDEHLDQSGLTVIRVKANVLEERLETDLAAIRVVLEAKGNPRTLVLIDETMDGKPLPLISQDIEEFLLDKTFIVIDKNQFDEIKKRDAADGVANRTKAMALAARFGAELILSGRAKTVYSGERNAYGIPVYSYSGNLSVKAISSDTGDVLAVLNERQTAHAGNRVDAGRRALIDTWNRGKDAFLQAVLEKWRSSILNSTQYTIIIANCPPGQRRTLMSRLSSVRGIMDVFERTYRNGVSELSVKVDGVVSPRIDGVISDAIPELLLTSKTSNRIDYEVRSAD